MTNNYTTISAHTPSQAIHVCVTLWLRRQSAKAVASPKRIPLHPHSQKDHRSCIYDIPYGQPTISRISLTSHPRSCHSCTWIKYDCSVPALYESSPSFMPKSPLHYSSSLLNARTNFVWAAKKHEEVHNYVIQGQRSPNLLILHALMSCNSLPSIQHLSPLAIHTSIEWTNLTNREILAMVIPLISEADLCSTNSQLQLGCSFRYNPGSTLRLLGRQPGRIRVLRDLLTRCNRNLSLQPMKSTGKQLQHLRLNYATKDGPYT